MLDLHTHILPGMDDGSRSVEQSIMMLEREALQGIQTVVMTPHYHANRESPADFVFRREAAEQRLRSGMAGRTDLPALLTGAEVAYFDGMCRVDDLERLKIGNTSAILIEMPFCRWNQRMLNELVEIQQVRGIQPILAHVERYMSYQPKGLIEQLGDSGMGIQVNTTFILRWQTCWRAMTMLKRQSIHFVASDCHDMERRVPNLGEAMAKIDKKLGAETMAFLRQREEQLIGGMK